MSEDSAIIDLPQASPGEVEGAGSSLARVSGGFERTGGGVARAVTAVGSWQGQASVTFRATATTYREAATSVAGVLAHAQAAVRRYANRLEEARERIRGLRREEEDAVERLRLEKLRLDDATERADDARGRLTGALLPFGPGDAFSMVAVESAQRDIDAAEADAARAERAITREREELERLRRAAEREREALEEAELIAAWEVRAAAAGLPDVALPGGVASPPALAGTAVMPFSWLSPTQRQMLASGREWEADQAEAAEQAEEEGENDGNAWDGLGKALGDVKDEAVGLGTGAFNHVNVFNGDKLKETWSNDWDTGKAIWNDLLGLVVK